MSRAHVAGVLLAGLGFPLVTLYSYYLLAYNTFQLAGNQFRARFVVEQQYDRTPVPEALAESLNVYFSLGPTKIDPQCLQARLDDYNVNWPDLVVIPRLSGQMLEGYSVSAKIFGAGHSGISSDLQKIANDCRL